MNRVTRLAIITGDPSGDQHAASVVAKLRALRPDVEIAAVGGASLAAQGVRLIADQTGMGRVGAGAVWGAWHHYCLGRQILRFLEDFQPQIVLLIDYGGFNLLLAEQIRRRFGADSPALWYFIPPQIWASRPGRIRRIQAHVDRVFCIFPFEVALYETHGVPVTYAGHPLTGVLPPPADRVAFCAEHGLDPARPVLALLPGSRGMEISYLLAPLIGAGRRLQETMGLQAPQLALSRSSALSLTAFDRALQQAYRREGRPPLRFIDGDARALLSIADAAIVKSGTSTLEAALYQTPMIIVYRGHPLFAAIARRVCLLPSIGLPNILTDPYHPFVIERLQESVTPQRLSEDIQPLLLPDTPEREALRAGYARIRDALGSQSASQTVAGALADALPRLP
ncbi:MAG: lipid-A-disaccharide synthase [Vampirovibrionales bacterium]|nr:lipid-A-disaccharide synthase [Vampirovibrionales bacterium]